MKVPSQDLYRLIHAMTLTERKHFKKSNNMVSCTMELFERIEEMHFYDEEQLKLDLSNASFAKNLKVHKNRLQHLLMSFLRQQNQGFVSTSQLRGYVQNVEILIQKKLYDLAYEAIQKAKKACLEYEDYEHLLLVLGIEARQFSYFQEFTPTDSLTPMQQMLDCLGQIENYVRLAEVNKKILSIYERLEYPASSDNPNAVNHALTQIIEIEVEQAGLQPKTPVAQRLYDHCYAICCMALGRYAEALRRSEQILAQFETHNLLKTEKYMQYFNCLVNHLPHCINARNFAAFEQTVQQLATLAGQHEGLQAMFLYVQSFQIYALKAQGQTAAALNFMADEVQPLIETYNLQQTYAASTSYLMLFECGIVEGRSDLVGHYLLQFFQDKNMPQPLLWVGYVLELIYHLEQGDFLLIDNFVQAHLKRLRRQEQGDALIESILFFCKRWANLKNRRDAKMLDKHREELKQMDLKAQGFWHLLNRYFPYLLWLESLNSDKVDFKKDVKKEMTFRYI